MPEVTGKGPFEERLKIVLDELSLGIQWDRPSLIGIIYRSVYIKNLISSLLKLPLEESGQVAMDYFVDKTHYDIPAELLKHPLHNKAVYFVDKIRWGGGRGYSNAYRALNMHREYLIDGNIRAIFWLTQNEVKQLSRYAPDFWAFRHKVVEFLELPQKNDLPPRVSSNRKFHKLYARNARDFQSWIKTGEQFYAQGCIDEALFNFRKALRKYPDQSALNLQIAEIYISMGRVPAATRILRQVKKNTAKREELNKEINRLAMMAAIARNSHGGFSINNLGK